MKFLFVFSALLLILECGYGYPSKNHDDVPDQVMAASDQKSADESSAVYVQPSIELQTEETRITEQEPEGGGQTFFPSFSLFHNPPLGHSRPYFFQQEGAYSQRPSSFHQQLGYETPRFSGYKGDSYSSHSTANTDTHGLLGSGNFGVISGGTFYNDNDGEASKYSEDFTSFFNNGHGRPSYYFGRPPNPKPQQHEQFANFRDFADINTPNPAYSEFVVVYVNRNGTKVNFLPNSNSNVQKAPKNIIERLAMLDYEVPTSTTTEIAPTKKLSKSKRKLAVVLPEKKHLVKKTPKTKTPINKDLYEPLLALS